MPDTLQANKINGLIIECADYQFIMITNIGKDLAKLRILFLKYN
jgi:hypothetical protein